MRTSLRIGFGALVLLAMAPLVQAVLPPQRATPYDFDLRGQGTVTSVAQSQAADGDKLVRQVPGVRISHHPITGSARWVQAETGFLTGPEGKGGGVSQSTLSALPPGEPHRVVKAFLNEHSALFGHDAAALDSAKLQREFTTSHSGLKTVVWEQEFDGITVFEGLLIAHTTFRGELVSISDCFVSSPAQAALQGTPNRAALQTNPAIAAAQAVVVAAGTLDEALRQEQVEAVARPEGAAMQQSFRSVGLNGETRVRLVWLPLGAGTMRLCWEVLLTSRSRGELFRVLIDAGDGKAWLRQCLTSYITDASYRVYTSDSPSPFSPGFSAPSSTQPPTVARGYVTWGALDTNASPAGWIADGVNDTRGNNVDAHTDRDNNDVADVPRPQGSPFQVFDFSLDLSQSPEAYTNAAVTQLFYWNNWMHDKLYALGFTEAAGNFQNDNFGRGGLGNDAVQADAQDGGGYNNANFATPPDGWAPRMQMYVFTGPSPARDGDLDAEIILHEYTHGLSNRRVGGGVGMTALQSEGMGEGWSDFYALALLSEAGDDVDGVYASGAYACYRLAGLTQNYYFGIRRYPYCTDLGKNPLTFKDIDPAQAGSHAGVPRSPIIGSTANEVHNMGEVWCVTLWEARANLIRKRGWAVGSQLALQLVTDGMNLAPPNPNYLEARDAILQADQVANGGANLSQLWAAFAKRGMGPAASSPPSTTTSGVQESYGLPGEIYKLVWSVVPSPVVVNEPFAVTLTAVDALNVVATNFSGVVALSCTTTSSVVVMSPTNTGNFVHGVWTGSLVVGQSARRAVLRADDGLGHTGLSNPFNAVPSNQPPTILTQPASQVAIVGSNVVFWVEPDGTPPFAYQWTREGTNLDGATTSSLALTGVQFEEEGVYAVAVSNDFGFIISSNATLRVIPPPPCAPLPAGLVAWWTAENNALDSAGTNNGALKGQAGFEQGKVGQGFSFDGVRSYVQVADKPGLRFADNLTIELWYRDDGCVAGNYAGLIAKRAPYPEGCNFGINILPGGAGVLQLYFQDPGLKSYQVSDFSPLPAVGVFHHLAGTYRQIDAQQIELKTYIDGQLVKTATIPGNLSRTLNNTPITIGASNPTDEFFKGVIDEVGLYRRVLSDAEVFGIYAAGSSGKCHALTAPVITSQPVGQTVVAGADVSFSVTASANPPPVYQWLKDGITIPTATDSAYSINGAGTNDAGDYAVVVSNVVGWVLSSNATLVVSPAAPCAALPADAVAWWTGDGSSLDTLGTNHGTLVGGASYVPGRVGTAFGLDGTNGYVRVPDNPGLRFTNELTVELWFKDTGSKAGAYHGLIAKRAPYPDGCNFGINFLPDGAGVLQVYFQDPLHSSYQVSALSPLPTPGVFHHVAATFRQVAADSVELKTFVDGQLAQSAIVAGNLARTVNATPVTIGATYATSEFFKGTIDEVTIYRRALSNNEIQGIFLADVNGKCPVAPTITAQPQSQQVLRGSNATFSVTASGAPPLSYQWLFNSTNLNGQTARFLTITNVQSANAGTYAVRVSNPGGWILSSNAVLSLLYPPRIIRPPARQLAVPGCNILFTVLATGTAPLRYQWAKDSQPLDYQTNASLVLSDVQSVDLGNYRVTVTNLYGTVTSADATLSWDRPPTAWPDTIERFQAGGVRVRVADLVANDTDPDGDVLTVAEVGGTSAAGGIVTLQDGWVYYAPPSGFTNTDAFAYTVSDGHCGGRAVGVVTVLTRADDPQPYNLEINVGASGGWRLTFDGIPGYVYRLQYREALDGSDWADLAALTADSFGECQHIDWPTTSALTRFYRCVWP